MARRQNRPLYELLGGTRRDVPVYASGINPTGAADTIQSARERGYNAFKVKIGFGQATDIATLDSALAILSDDENLTGWPFTSVPDP